MSQHLAILMLHFSLEIAALVVAGQWGWQLTNSPMRFVYAIVVPLIMAAVWGVFRPYNEMGRGQKAPVPVSGRVRLVIEAAFFGFAVWSMFDRGQPVTGLALLGALALDYLLSIDRIAWLWNEEYYRKEMQSE